MDAAAGIMRDCGCECLIAHIDAYYLLDVDTIDLACFFALRISNDRDTIFSLISILFYTTFSVSGYFTDSLLEYKSALLTFRALFIYKKLNVAEEIDNA